MAGDERIQEYQAAVTTCASAGSMISLFDLPGILNAIERAHAVGPIVDPTLYREKMGAMQLDAELVKAALPLWKHVRKMQDEAQRQSADSR